MPPTCCDADISWCVHACTQSCIHTPLRESIHLYIYMHKHVANAAIHTVILPCAFTSFDIAYASIYI